MLNCERGVDSIPWSFSEALVNRGVALDSNIFTYTPIYQHNGDVISQIPLWYSVNKHYTLNVISFTKAGFVAGLFE